MSPSSCGLERAPRLASHPCLTSRSPMTPREIRRDLNEAGPTSRSCYAVPRVRSPPQIWQVALPLLRPELCSSPRICDLIECAVESLDAPETTHHACKTLRKLLQHASGRERAPHSKPGPCACWDAAVPDHAALIDRAAAIDGTARGAPRPQAGPHLCPNLAGELEMCEIAMAQATSHLEKLLQLARSPYPSPAPNPSPKMSLHDPPRSPRHDPHPGTRSRHTQAHRY